MSRRSPTVLVRILTFTIFITVTASLPQQSFTTPATPTSTQSLSDTHAIACATGGGDWYMDPAVAMELSAQFCERLVQPQNFPQPGIRTEDIGYPTDLGGSINTKVSLRRDQGARPGGKVADSAAGLTNTSLIEMEGSIAEFAFIRSYTSIVSSVLHVAGTDEQCARDNCSALLRHAINTCEFNKHHIGGMAMFLSDCGLYTLMVQNCSGNYVDPDCNRWHAKWPNVGLRENMTLVWNLTHGIGVNMSSNTLGTSEKMAGSQVDDAVDERGIQDRVYEVEAGLAKGLFWVGGRR